ncbi:MAG TPA: DNA polymerase III subunit chi [Cellvibrionaceae bacterium]|nr:DNA polymerase III subunit chi [Cellvibrionaceae bacterium]
MSGRADFYVLPAGEERYHFACRLIEKAYKLGNKVWLRLDEEALDELDERLWTFKPESFVPHVRFAPGTPMDDGLVWLVTQLPEGRCDLLVNLASSPLEPPQEAGRVVELVTQDAQVLQLTRQQYARYKALNWAINTHKL